MPGRKKKKEFIFYGPWLPVLCSSATISEKATISVGWSSEHFAFPVGLSPHCPRSPVTLSLGVTEGTNVSENVLIDIVCIWVTEEEERKPKMPPWSCPSPLLDRNWRRPGQTCVFPSLVSFWALHFVSFMSLKLLFYMPREQSRLATRLVLCCLGFPGSMKLGFSLRLLSLIIFNVRPKVIFNEAEKYINKIACSN